MVVRVERSGWNGPDRSTKAVTRKVVLVLNRQGQRIEARLTPTIREGRGVIGVKAAGEPIPFRYGIGSFRYGAETVIQHLAGSVSMIKSLIKPAAGSDIAGPLMVAKAGAEQASFGLMALLHFMGIVSTYLVVINLAPIPALDGGTILMALWEQASGKPVGMKIQRVLTAISGGLLVTLMLHALLNDLSRK